jgi:hypothetical protein
LTAIEPANFQFDLKDINYYTKYREWDYIEYTDDGPIWGPDLATKKKLRKGDYKTLNIYILYGFGLFEGMFAPLAVSTTIIINQHLTC